MMGIQICMLRGDSFEAVLDLFQKLQARFPLSACEIHLERSLYPSAIWPWESSGRARLAAVRPLVEKLGVHLPFMELNPISSNVRIAQASRRVLEESLEFAASAGADYAVFHARGTGPENTPGESDLSAWLDFVACLSEKAVQLGLVFCLENADDLRELKQVRELLQSLGTSVALCLDLGHLFERKYAPSFLSKMAYVLNDRFSPVPFLLKKGLPAQEGYRWPKVIDELGERIACIHLHNHDGRAAHRRLRSGKINLGPVRQFVKRLPDVPFVLEADYTRSRFEEITDDLRYAEALLS
jgi:sugar phosphate isomerase/epimerase